MQITRKIVKRESIWGTVQIPPSILRAWDGYNEVTIVWNPDTPFEMTIRPVAAGQQ